MSTVFLYSGITALDAWAQPFVEACGGPGGSIALLMVPRFKPHEVRCRQALLKAGAGEIQTVAPPANLVLSDRSLRTLERSTGMFMAGGAASVYQRIYGTRPASRLIQRRVAAGVPYGGLSAGSMMAADLCDVGHTAVRTKTNEFLLAAEGHAAPGGVDLKAGLGLVKDSVLQPHLSEWGQLPELFEDMRVGGSRIGLGLDDSICLELKDGRSAFVRGRGRLYVLRKRTKGTRSFGVELEAYEPGAHFDLATGKKLRRSDRIR